MQTGLVFNIQKYSVHDGPGIRTTVFLKGCPLRCWWCHNPESQSVEPEVSLNDSRCIHCGSCVRVCPESNGLANRALPFIDRDRCIRCGACAEACVSEAREMVGQTLSVDQVLVQVLQDRLFYDDSGGGVTLSGGEPLMQRDFAIELLRAFRSEGIHTALDTCGFVPPEDLQAAAPLTDLFLYDIKTMDDQLHRRFTGVSNGIILDNLERLGRIHGNIWLRLPVVPGHNDDDAQWESAARFAACIPGVRQIHLLPYHALAAHKSSRIGKRDRMNGTSGPSAQRLADLADRLRPAGLPVFIPRTL